MSTDRSKGHVDLSLKRVNDHQKRDKIKEWKNNRKVERLMEMLAKKLNKPVDQCYKDFGNDLTSKYGTLYTAFEETAYDQELLKNDGFEGEWLDEFKALAKENISIQFVEITGYLDVNSWLPDGVDHIRDALSNAEQSEFEDVEIQIRYIGAPQYMITVKAPDYKIAEGEMKKAVEGIEGEIEKYNGEFKFHRKAEE